MEKVEKWIIKLKKIVGEKAIGLVYFSIFSIIAIIAMATIPAITVLNVVTGLVALCGGVFIAMKLGE